MSWNDDLREEVTECIKAMHNMDINSDEYLKVVPRVMDMIDRLNESERLSIERDKFEAITINDAEKLEVEKSRIEDTKKLEQDKLDFDRLKFEMEKSRIEDIKKLEQDKLDFDRLKFETDTLNNDRALAKKDAELKAERYDHLIKNILTAVTFAGSAAVTIWGTLYSDNFDVDKIRGNEAGKNHIRNWLNFMR